MSFLRFIDIIECIGLTVGKSSNAIFKVNA